MLHTRMLRIPIWAPHVYKIKQWWLATVPTYSKVNWGGEELPREHKMW